MSKVHGKDSYFSLKDSANITLRSIGDYCDNIELSRDVDMGETTTIGLEDKTYLSGLAGATMSLGGKWDDAVTVGVDVVLSGNLGNDIPVDFEYGPAGNAVGKVKYSGVCYVEKYQVSSPLENIVKFTATLRISGIVTRGAFA